MESGNITRETEKNKKICQLQNPFALQNPLIDDSDEYISKLKVQVTAARDEVVMKEIKVY